MPILKFRISFDEYEDVYRDIEIKHAQSFESLKIAILDSLKFSKNLKSQFIESDDLWRKKTIIEDKVFAEKSIAEYIDDPRKRFLFLYDIEGENWNIQVELMKLMPDNDKLNFPRCVSTVGLAPQQFKFKDVPKFVPPTETKRKTIVMDEAEEQVLDNDFDPSFLASVNDEVESKTSARGSSSMHFDEDFSLDDEEKIESDEDDDFDNEEDDDYGSGEESYGNEDYDDRY